MIPRETRVCPVHGLELIERTTTRNIIGAITQNDPAVFRFRVCPEPGCDRREPGDRFKCDRCDNPQCLRMVVSAPYNYYDRERGDWGYTLQCERCREGYFMNDRMGRPRPAGNLDERLKEWNEALEAEWPKRP